MESFNSAEHVQAAIIKFYASVETIVNNTGNTQQLAIDQADWEISEFVRTTHQDVAIRAYIEAFQDPSTSVPFKQYIMSLLNYYVNSVDLWNQSTEEVRVSLKTSLLSGYWSENDDTPLLASLAEYIVQLYTKFGDNIFEIEQAGVLAPDAEQLMTIIDETMKQDDPKSHLKSLTLFNAFVENLGYVEPIFEKYILKLSPFLDITNKLNPRLTNMALKIVMNLLSGLQGPINFASDFLYQRLNDWINIFIQQKYFDGIHSCVVAWLEGMGKLTFTNSEMNSQLELLLNGQEGPRKFLQDSTIPRECRIGVVYLIIRILEMETLQITQLNFKSLIEITFDLLKQGLEKEESTCTIAFELEALDANGFVLNSCTLIARLARHCKALSDFQSLMKYVNFGMNGDVLSKSASFLAMGVIAKLQREHIMEEMGNFMAPLTKGGGGTPSPLLIKSCRIYAISQAASYLSPGIFDSEYSKVVVQRLFQHLDNLFIRIENNDQLDWPICVQQCQDGLVNLINDEFMKTKLSAIIRKLRRAEKTNSVRVQYYCVTILRKFALNGVQILKRHFEVMLNFVKVMLEQTIVKDTASEIKPDAVELAVECFEFMGTLVNFYACSPGQLEYFVSQCVLFCGDPNTDMIILDRVYSLIIAITTTRKEILSEPLLRLIVDQMLDNLKINVNLNTGEMQVDEIEKELNNFDLQNDETMENAEEELLVDMVDGDNGYMTDPIGLDNDVLVSSTIVVDKINIMNRLVELHRAVGNQFNPLLKSTQSVVEAIAYSSLSAHSHVLKVAALTALTNLIMLDFILTDKSLKRDSAKAIGKSIIVIIKNQLQPPDLSHQNIEVLTQYLNFIRWALQYDGKELIRVTSGLREYLQELLKSVIYNERIYSPPLSPLSDEALQDEECTNLTNYFSVIINTMKYFGESIDVIDFINYFSDLIPFMSSKLENHPNFFEQVFLIGLTSDMVKVFRRNITPFSELFISWFVKYSGDPCPQVQQSAIYGLGELARFSSGETLNCICQCIYSQVGSQDPGVNDNIVAAFSKIVISDPNNFAAAGIIPYIIAHLPLEVDILEYGSVFGCFTVLLSGTQTNDLISECFVEPLVLSMVHMIQNKSYLVYVEDFNESHQICILGSRVMKLLQTQYPDKCTEVLETLHPDRVQSLIKSRILKRNETQNS